MAARKSKAKSNISKEELLKFYREMLLIRRFEEKAGQLYGMGLIGGFCHLYIGQEAVVVGLEATAKDGDQRITSYRDHGHMLACGMDPNGVMAELTGREGGYSKARAARCICSRKRRNSMAAMGASTAENYDSLVLNYLYSNIISKSTSFFARACKPAMHSAKRSTTRPLFSIFQISRGCGDSAPAYVALC